MIAMNNPSEIDMEIEKKPSIDNGETILSSCVECSLPIYTDFGVKLHREVHQTYAAFVDKYAKV